jgi:hypothetical protein
MMKYRKWNVEAPGKEKWALLRKTKCVVLVQSLEDKDGLISCDAVLIHADTLRETKVVSIVYSFLEPSRTVLVKSLNWDWKMLEQYALKEIRATMHQAMTTFLRYVVRVHGFHEARQLFSFLIEETADNGEYVRYWPGGEYETVF